MINRQPSGFTKLDIAESKSGVQSLQIDLAAVLADRGDDVEGHSQSAPSVFESHHGPGTILHRLQK